MRRAKWTDNAYGTDTVYSVSTILVSDSFQLFSDPIFVIVCPCVQGGSVIRR